MILFIHIPKAAGSHFRTILDRVYTPDQIVYDYGDRVAVPSSPFNADPVRWRRESNEAVRNLSPRVEMIFGHFSVTKYLDLLPQAELMTWVREPISRLISMYFYLKAQDDLPGIDHVILTAAKTVSFLEFAEIPINQNMLTRLYLHPAGLDDFSFLGIQEHFEEDLRELTAKLKWPPFAAPAERVNTNPFTDYRRAVCEIKSDRELIRKIERMNRADVELYRACVERRHRRLRTERRTWLPLWKKRPAA